MNKDKIEIDKNKIPLEVRKNINLALNRDGYALVDTKWLVKENFIRKETTMENIMNSDCIYFINNKFVEKIRINNYVLNKYYLIINIYDSSNISSCSINDHKKIWAFSPCDLEGMIKLE